MAEATERSVVVASAGLSAGSPAPGELLALLDDHERRRHRSLHQSIDRDRFMVAHALLRLTIAEVAGMRARDIELTASCRQCGSVEHGRPVVTNAAYDVSLTRSGRWVAVAVSTAGPVGIDVERNGSTAFDGYPDVALAPGETASTVLDRGIVWARKEAILKAIGLGLAVPPSTLMVSAADAPAKFVRWIGQAPTDRPVQLNDLRLDPDYSGAVALLSEHPPVLRSLDGDALIRQAAPEVRHRTATH